MKRNLIGTLSLVALSSLLNVTGAAAQAVAKCDVPFAFTVAKQQMPAGSYSIVTNNEATMQIQNNDTGATVLSLVRSELPSDRAPRLVFHYVGNQYFLSQVWGREGSAGMTIPASSLEKELRIAGNGTGRVGEVVIALK
jgi:hypothetical protein